MPRVLRTRKRPLTQVIHLCRDDQGRRVMRYGLSNTLCRQCNTQIVYVWDNKPKTKRRIRNGNKASAAKNL